jgi:hypothetical protein
MTSEASDTKLENSESRKGYRRNRSSRDLSSMLCNQVLDLEISQPAGIAVNPYGNPLEDVVLLQVGHARTEQHQYCSQQAKEVEEIGRSPFQPPDP